MNEEMPQYRFQCTHVDFRILAYCHVENEQMKHTKKKNWVGFKRSTETKNTRGIRSP